MGDLKNYMLKLPIFLHGSWISKYDAQVAHMNWKWLKCLLRFLKEHWKNLYNKLAKRLGEFNLSHLHFKITRFPSVHWTFMSPSVCIMISDNKALDKKHAELKKKAFKKSNLKKNCLRSQDGVMGTLRRWNFHMSHRPPAATC